MIMPFINTAAAKAVSLEESVFMCVSERRWLSSILTGITQQGPCQLQKGSCGRQFPPNGAMRVTADSVRGRAGHMLEYQNDRRLLTNQGNCDPHLIVDEAPAVYFAKGSPL